MLRVVQYVLLAIYVVLPPAMLIWSWRDRRRGWIGPLLLLLVNCLLGTIVGIGLLLVNVDILGGRVSMVEGARLVYLVIAALCFLRLLDRLLMLGALRLGRVRTDARGRPAAPAHPRTLLVLLGQRALLVAIAIPYIFSLLITYRPKIRTEGHPGMLGLEYTRAAFTSRDGIDLAGWWISAEKRPASTRAEAAEQWGRRSVILCHGVGSSKERQLPLAWLLASRGYNVLAFDFRGHGDSDGHFISYGDLERFDVVAAARWIKDNHPAEAQRIFGIGVNTGAVALLAAAAEPEDGQLIDALVLSEPYARFRTLAETTAGRTLPWGIRWLAEEAGLPLASVHAGANLNGFQPVELVERIWPRPVLVIHGRGMSFVPVGEEMDLYQQMPSPKEQFWPADNYVAERAHLERLSGERAIFLDMVQQWLGTREGLSGDAGVQYRTLQFLRNAESLPVI